MLVEDLIRTYPRLYHMAEANCWPSVKRIGLLSTAALLDRCGINGKERERLERCHRPECRTITSAGGDEAYVIRDQKPMSDGGLKRALAGSGLTPADWYRLVNRRVYFWLSETRLSTLLNARAYRNRMHSVLTIDAGPFVRSYEPVIELSPINSGSTFRVPQPRSRETFRSIAGYPFEDWRKKRGRSGAVVELTIPYRVPDIADFVLRVEHRLGNRTVELLYEASQRT